MRRVMALDFLINWQNKIDKFADVALKKCQVGNIM